MVLLRGDHIRQGAESHVTIVSYRWTSRKAADLKVKHPPPCLEYYLNHAWRQTGTALSRKTRPVSVIMNRTRRATYHIHVLILSVLSTIFSVVIRMVLHVTINDKFRQQFVL